MDYPVNNPRSRLKTGKRKRAGRPKGKYNCQCCDCGKYFHVAPSHLGRTCRCHRCRKGKRGRKPDYLARHTCPLCGGYKHNKSNICVICWESGRRYDAVRRQAI